MYVKLNKNNCLIEINKAFQIQLMMGRYLEKVGLNVKTPPFENLTVKMK